MSFTIGTGPPTRGGTWSRPYDPQRDNAAMLAIGRAAGASARDLAPFMPRVGSTSGFEPPRPYGGGHGYYRAPRATNPYISELANQTSSLGGFGNQIAQGIAGMMGIPLNMPSQDQRDEESLLLSKWAQRNGRRASRGKSGSSYPLKELIKIRQRYRQQGSSTGAQAPGGAGLVDPNALNAMLQDQLTGQEGETNRSYAIASAATGASPSALADFILQSGGKFGESRANATRGAFTDSATTNAGITGGRAQILMQLLSMLKGGF